MIIDIEKNEEEQKKIDEKGKELTKQRFKEFCEMELQKKVIEQ